MEYTASRLSDGNSLFPAEIHTEDNGIKVRIPGFMSGKNTFIPYANISGVSVDSPMVGYSTISFFAQGKQISVHGFSQDDAESIKNAIENSAYVEHEHEHEHEYNEPEEQGYVEEKPKTHKTTNKVKSIYRNSQSILEIDFPESKTEIEKITLRLIQVGKTLTENDDDIGVDQLKRLNACILKVEEGIDLLKIAKSTKTQEYQDGLVTLRSFYTKAQKKHKKQNGTSIGEIIGMIFLGILAYWWVFLIIVFVIWGFVHYN
jgi:hypothetical protein